MGTALPPPFPIPALASLVLQKPLQLAAWRTAFSFLLAAPHLPPPLSPDPTSVWAVPLSPAGTMGSRHFPARTVLFEKESTGVTYRVPALIYLPCVAKLLAFAEERLSADDAHANLLVLRRGTVYGSYVEVGRGPRGGRMAPRVLGAHYSLSKQWEDMRVLETAALQHHRSMNPCPLYDEFTGTLFLFFITVLGRTPEAFQIVTGQNVTRLCCVTSADQGLSWSKATDLTQQVIGRAIKGSTVAMQGSGRASVGTSKGFRLQPCAARLGCSEGPKAEMWLVTEGTTGNACSPVPRVGHLRSGPRARDPAALRPAAGACLQLPHRLQGVLRAALQDHSALFRLLQRRPRPGLAFWGVHPQPADRRVPAGLGG